MLGESAIAARGRDAERTSSSEVHCIIVTLLQLYDETTRKPQHQRTKYCPNRSNNGHHPTKNGQEMDIDKDDSIKYLRQERKRRTQRVAIVYHDKSIKYLRQSTKEKNSKSCDCLPRQVHKIPPSKHEREELKELRLSTTTNP
jgi:hypothetical protein